MRLALISDIHSNFEALSACFEMIDRSNIDTVACLGDTIGYGASPNECLDLLRTRCDHVVLGNHDAAVIDAEEANYFNGDARAAVEWTRARLSDENLAYLEHVPMTATVGDAMLVHSTPSAPRDWRYLFHSGDAEIEFGAFTERLCFYGHTHLPTFFVRTDDRLEQHFPPVLTLEDGARAIVNVGSVGQPRDGDPRSSFCIYDSDESSVEIHRIHYDIEQVQGRILDTPLPKSGAERLAWGV